MIRRGALVLVAAMALAGAGCGEPDPYERQQQRLEERRTETERAKAQREMWERTRREKGEAAETPAQIKRGLIEKYGAELTPFQRSALLASPIATREEGEAKCRRWIEENRGFERQGGGHDQ